MGSKRKRGPRDVPEPTKNSQKKPKHLSKANGSETPNSKPNLEKLPFVETPIGEERKREAALYELLGSEDDNERIEAADCIVSGLLGGDCVPESVLVRHLDRRLFRGLASGRNASRIGFSLVITELLGQLFGEKDLAGSTYSSLTFDKVLALLVDKTQAVGSIPGQEERDHFFGQLFGIEAFVRSHVLFRDASRWNAVLDLVLKLSNKKIWLRSQCGWVLVQGLSEMGKNEAESTLKRIADAGLAKTPEGVACWLVTLDRFPDLQLKPWQHPLHKKSLAELTSVLKESFNESTKDPSEKGRGNSKNASWTAQLHFVWDIILTHYVKGSSSEAGNFELFWNRVVDDGLFSKQATDGQKFKGFMVFQKMLEGLVEQHDKLRVLFSKNLMTCLMNQAAKEDRYLHRAATKALKATEAVVSDHSTALVPVLQCLLGKHGAYNFDQRTATKTIDKLTQNIRSETEEETLAIIREPMLSLETEEVQNAQNTLRVYVDYLSKILNASSSTNSETSTSGGSTFGLALGELSRLAYTQPEELPPPILTDQIRELCRARLESCLAKLTRRTDDFVVFCKAVESINLSPVGMTDEIRSAIENAMSRMQKLLKRKSKNEEDKSLSQGLALLHAISIFQLYNEDPDAMEVINDLSQYYDRIKSGNLGDKTVGSSELLVEILLSMVARPSSLMRQVSQQVFETFTSQISAEGLELLTDPLASGESSKGQRELFNTEDDGMEIDENEHDEEDGPDAVDIIDVDDDSDVQIDSDIEFVDLNGENIVSSGDEEGDESDEESHDDDDDNDEENGDEKEEDGEDYADLDEALGKILNSHRLDKDKDAESSSSDSDMSDSEMLALDDKLSAAIKHRIGTKPDSKKQKKDAKQSVVNFKHRILDLLDIYVRNEALNPLTFAVLVPLLHLMRTTTTKPVASRACEIILNYQKGLKKARANRDDIETTSGSDVLLPLLVEVHEEAGKDNSHAYTKAASAASLIIVSAMFAGDATNVKDAAAVYAKTQSDWVLGAARLQNSFFADWNNWCQNHASKVKSAAS